MPRPPPPAVALSMMGYPISLAISLPSFTESMIPSEPGIVGTPARFMVSLAVALSPILLIISALAPMNLIPYSSQTLENSAFSAKNP